MGQRIAVIGAGISGLGAAWALSPDNDVTVFEADTRPGGHSHTVEVDAGDGVVAVDTGFIVYNEVTYPHLTRLFAALDVPTTPTDMSFSFSRGPRFEYAASLRGMLGKPSNLSRRRFRRMLGDIQRFRRMSDSWSTNPGESIGGWLARNGFGDGFVHDYLLPMSGAVWSTGSGNMLDFPAEAILTFLQNHGLIDVISRPEWRTVVGGSREYVKRLLSETRCEIRTGTPVTSVTRLGGSTLIGSPGSVEEFEHVIVATHSDQALQMLGDDATDEERRLLGTIPYRDNAVVLHTDNRLMPASRRLWSSWNAISIPGGGHASVTYWMNSLQRLDTGRDVFVSLNPLRSVEPARTLGSYRYAHPQYGPDSIRVQAEIASIQGRHNTWFAGAYLGYGFHEDGLQSGLSVAAALGSPAPWHASITPMSSAPILGSEVAA